MRVMQNAVWPTCDGSDSMDKRVLAKLGMGLRGVYQDLTEGPLPEVLATLVRELEKREQRRNAAAG